MQAGSAAWTADALAKGLGRVVLRAKSRRALDHADAVIDACVHNFCYDADVEGTRAVWMLMLLDAAAATGHVRKRIYAAAQDVRSRRDLRQSRHMLALLARRGDAEARQGWQALVLRGHAADAENLNAAPSPETDGWSGLTAAQVVARVHASGEFLPWRWCKAASVDDLLHVSQAILATPEHKHVQQFTNLLAPLGSLQNPELVPALLRLSALPGRLGYRAFRALARYTHPGVRTLAEERMHAGLADWRTLALLVRNFKPGDYEHVRRLFDAMRSQDPCERHWFYGEITTVFEHNPHVDAADLLYRTYEDGPCALCRKHCVEGLLKLDRLPKSLAQECAYDSLDDTRALFRGK